jgi:hypothetical protein
VLEKWGLLLHIKTINLQLRMCLCLSSWKLYGYTWYFIWNSQQWTLTGQLASSTMSKATPQTSRDLNSGIRELQLQNSFINVTDYLISHGTCVIVFHTFLQCPIFGLKKKVMEPCIIASKQNYTESTVCTLENWILIHSVFQYFAFAFLWLTKNYLDAKSFQIFNFGKNLRF